MVCTEAKTVFTHLSSSLGFASFLLIVSSHTFGFQFLSLSILFLIIAEEINFVVVVSCCRCGSGSSRCESLARCARSGKGTMLRCVRLDVCVPPCGVGVFGRIRCRAELFEYMNIGLRRCVAVIRILSTDWVQSKDIEIR